jgi:polyhydroxyalkanoate synthesis regulator phasin
LSFHQAACTPKWDSILQEGNLKNNAAQSFISLLMRKTEKKKREEEEEKTRVPNRIRMVL